MLQEAPGFSQVQWFGVIFLPAQALGGAGIFEQSHLQMPMELLDPSHVAARVTLGVLGVSAPICAKGGQGKLHQHGSSESLAKLPTQTLGKALEELQESAVLWGLRWFHPKESLRKFIFRAGFPLCVEPEVIPAAQQSGVAALQSLQAGPSTIKSCSSG